MKKVLLLACLCLLTQGYAAPTRAKKPVPFKALRKIECKMKPRMKHDRIRVHQKIREGTSENWSGYAAATNLKNPGVGSVSMVSGTWTVPDISNSKKGTFASIWVGIDGYSSGTVEQIGTEHDWDNGVEEHYAWFEMYPKYPHEISGFPVEPGDVISAQVSYKGNDIFEMVINNHTKGITTTIPTEHTKAAGTKRNSAEWIVEAPATANGILPLANFKQTVLSDCTATINGTTNSINGGKWQFDKLVMETKSGGLKASTSEPTNGGQDFTVVWKHQ